VSQTLPLLSTTQRIERGTGGGTVRQKRRRRRKLSEFVTLFIFE
jgi:hypothetical protein